MIEINDLEGIKFEIKQSHSLFMIYGIIFLLIFLLTFLNPLWKITIVPFGILWIMYALDLRYWCLKKFILYSKEKQ